MTDPVILLGTQSNGETLPVQVDGFGRLVAEGLQGPEGPEGPQGPQGPEGPPGPGGIQLPPDPYEGALLGWLNDGLAWIGNAPIPIPPGYFGPITSWDSNGLMEVQPPIPPEVGPGVYIEQAQLYPTGGVGNWVDVLVGGVMPGPYSKTNLFNGTWQEGRSSGGTLPAVGSWLNFSPPNLSSAKKVTIVFACDGGDPSFLKINGENVTSCQGTKDATYYTQSVDGSGLQSIEWYSESGSTYVDLKAIVVDGMLLAENAYPQLSLRINQVVGEDSLLAVPSESREVTVGCLLQVPSQRVAPWVLYGNDPTSLIDHLRSS